MAQVWGHRGTAQVWGLQCPVPTVTREIPAPSTASAGQSEPRAVPRARAQAIRRKTSPLGGSLLSLQQRVIMAQGSSVQSSAGTGEREMVLY